MESTLDRPACWSYRPAGAAGTVRSSFDSHKLGVAAVGNTLPDILGVCRVFGASRLGMERHGRSKVVGSIIRRFVMEGSA